MRIRSIRFKNCELDTDPDKTGISFKDRERWMLWLRDHYGATSKRQMTWGLAWRDVEFRYWDHGPAVKERASGYTGDKASFNYPERFKGLVPRTIRLLRTVTDDILMKEPEDRLQADRDNVYPAWTNEHGAVSAILPNGEKLGLYPHEFEVDSWLHASEIEG